MLYKFFRFIILLLPYYLVVQLYKYNKAIPANIRTRTGRTLKAVMINERYGLLFDSSNYIKNRVKILKQQQQQLNEQNNYIAEEMNKLSFEARELFFEES